MFIVLPRALHRTILLIHYRTANPTHKRCAASQGGNWFPHKKAGRCGAAIEPRTGGRCVLPHAAIAAQGARPPKTKKKTPSCDDASKSITITQKCERWDSNPHASRHRNLNPACLPISPLSHAYIVDCFFMGAEGIEPSTYGLRVRCSAS